MDCSPLQAIAEARWQASHGEKSEVPAGAIPTEGELRSWVEAECPEAEKQNALDRLRSLCEVADAMVPQTTELAGANRAAMLTALAPGLTPGKVLTDGDVELLGEPAPRFRVGEVHNLWRLVGRAERRKHDLSHPISVLVEAWQRRHGTRPFEPIKIASLPALGRIKSDEDVGPGPRLPTGIAARATQDKLPLPGFEAAPECISWLLWLYERAGGLELHRSAKGAPLAERLFIGSFLHLGIRQRNNQWHTLRFPTLRAHEADWPVPGVKSIEAWLYPNDWLNRRRDFQRLPEALDAMRERLSYVPVMGIGSVAMVYPSVIPRTPDHPFVEFTIRVPRSAAHGARLNWNVLREYGSEALHLWRAYLSAMAFIDRSAHRGQGITAEVRAPLLDRRGRPMRRNGRVVRATHETAQNPLRHLVLPVTDHDLARMMRLDPTDKRRRHDARRAFERISDDGVIDLKRERRRLYLFAAPQS